MPRQYETRLQQDLVRLDEYGASDDAVITGTVLQQPVTGTASQQVVLPADSNCDAVPQFERKHIQGLLHIGSGLSWRCRGGQQRVSALISTTLR